MLASAEGLTVITVEDLLLAAVELDLLGTEKIKATYEALRPFGSGFAELAGQHPQAEAP